MSILNYSLKQTNSSLPRVFITSVELSEGREEKKTNRNPHTGQDSPDVGFRSASGAKPMKVQISLCIKQQDPIRFASQQLSEQIKLAVVQVTNVGTKNKINKDPLTYLPSKMADSNIAGATVSFYSLQDLISKNITFDRNAGSFSQKDPFILANYKKIPFSKEVSLDGTTLYNIPLEAVFTISAEEGGTRLNNLSYYCYTFLDTQNTSNDYLLSRKRQNNVESQYSIGPIASENIITEGTTPDVTHLFKTKQGQIWTGEVHQMENGNWMTGAYHSKKGKELTKIKLPNLKLKDHRIFDSLSNITFQTKSPTDLISVRQKVRSQRVKDGMENEFVKKVPTISDMYMSRDKNNNCRFLFSVDMEQILKQNTNYPALIDNLRNTNKKEYYSLLKRARIEELTISRRRVIKQEIVTSNFDTTSYSPTDQELIVVSSKDSLKRNGLESKTSVDRATTQGVGNRSVTKTGTILEVKPFASSKTIALRHFTGTDFDISAQDTGLYEYTVKIVLMDPVQAFIKSKLEAIGNIIDGDGTGLSLNQYYVDATRARANYDKFLNRFDDTFLDKFNKNYVVGNSNFLFSSINEFIGIVFSLTNQINIGNVSMVEAVNYLTNISSPNTGSPEGIQKVIQLMERIKNSLNTAYSSNKSYIKSRNTTSEATNANANLGSTLRTKLYTVEKTFKNKFDSSTPKTIGFDYLFTKGSAISPNKDGITVINKSAIDNRFDLEVKKYYSSESPSLEIKNGRGDILNVGDNINYTKYSFLSPSNILLETQNKDVVFESLKSAYVASNRKEMNSLVNDIVIYNKTKDLYFSKSTNSSNREDITATSIEQMLSDSGAVLRTPIEIQRERTLKTQVFNKESRVQNIDDGDNLFDASRQIEEEKAVSSRGMLESILQVSETDFLDESNSVYSYLFNDDDSAEKIKKQLTNAVLGSRSSNRSTRTVSNPFIYSPNQIKALMLSLQNSSEVKTNKAFDQPPSSETDRAVDVFKNPENYGFFWFNYKSIKMIEVLVGFDSRGSAPLVNSQIWTRLEERHLNASRNKTLICRLVPYESITNGIKANNNLELPVFNEVFAINLNGSRNGRNANKSIPFVSFTDREIQNKFSKNKFSEELSQISDYYEKRKRFTEPRRSTQSDLVRSEFITSNLVRYENEIPASRQRTMKTIEFANEQLQANKNLKFNQIKDKIKQNGLEKYLPDTLKSRSSLTTSISNQRSSTSNTSGGTGGGSTY
jgi:hypothetical protein